MNVTFRQLKVFLAVAEQLNITAAARVCCVTQPTVSMQLRELTGTVTVGQELPMLRVPAPNAREVK